MTRFAVSDVALATTVLLTVMPAPLIAMVDPATKFVPVSVIDIVEPGMPAAGAMAVNVGASAVAVGAPVDGVALIGEGADAFVPPQPPASTVSTAAAQASCTPHRIL